MSRCSPHGGRRYDLAERHGKSQVRDPYGRFLCHVVGQSPVHRGLYLAEGQCFPGAETEAKIRARWALFELLWMSFEELACLC